MINDRCRAIASSRWLLPLFSLGMGGVVLLAGWHSGNPYGWLGALGGLSYVIAVAFFRWRG